MLGYISCLFILLWLSSVYFRDNKKFKSIKASMKIEKEDEIELRSIAHKHLGLSGKSITFDPKAYMTSYPDKIVVFKSNIFTKNGSMIWFGDINITDNQEKLLELSSDLGTTIYIMKPSEKDLSKYVFMTNGKNFKYGN